MPEMPIREAAELLTVSDETAHRRIERRALVGSDGSGGTVKPVAAADTEDRSTSTKSHTL